MKDVPVSDIEEAAWGYILMAIIDKVDGEVAFSQPTSKEVLDKVLELTDTISKLRRNYFVWNMLKGM